MHLDSQPTLKMLIVDDEADNLDLLHRTFRLEFQILRANSGTTALKMLDQHPDIAIIISDQRMPDMLGTDFLSRTVERFPDTIRIILTAYTDATDLVAAINSGQVFKYITKPWKAQALQTAVHQAAATYKLVKQRTSQLQQALKRQSTFNTVTTAIRESLDYSSMLATVVQAIGHSFDADCGLLHAVDAGQRVAPPWLYMSDGCDADLATLNADITPLLDQVLTSGQAAVQTIEQDDQIWHHLVLACHYQNQVLAVLDLVRSGPDNAWLQSDIEMIEEVAEPTAIAISQAKLHQHAQQQAEQIQAELAVAQQIQACLLHTNIPQFDHIRIQACCQPARAVGGDFFEVYHHPQGDLWLAVGDVSGKGVPAALLMASILSVLRRELVQTVSPEPEGVIHRLNQALIDDLVSTNCFITMILAKFNLNTRQLDYINAGHIYPMIWPPAQLPQMSEPEYLTDRGIPLGILANWQGESGRRQMRSGECLLLTSDGITEAAVPVPLNLSHRDHQATSPAQLQQSGLWQLLKQHSQPLDLADLLHQIQQQTIAQTDDQTILSLEVL